MRRVYQDGLVLVLILFCFGMSAFVSREVFHGLPHLEDEIAYLYQARIFAGGQVVVDTPEPRRSFWQPFVVDYDGRRFGKYTIGYPLALALGVLMGAWWVVNALGACLSVALVYRLGGEIFNRDVGVIGAGLLAFSPMALLLNGTLMPHALALCYGLVFVLAYRRLEGDGRLRWGALAGVMLGLFVLTRPLTALAFAFPFIVMSGARLAVTLWMAQDRLQVVWRRLAPLLVLSVVTLGFAGLTPAFNAIATGDARQNLYELVWHYDRIGFGECCGRNGHTLEKAFFHARYDLSLTAADLFGWQLGVIDEGIRRHWLTSSSYYPNVGLSFLLLPLGLFIGLGWRSGRRLVALWRWLGGAGWLLVAVLWVLWGVHQPQALLRDATFAWGWILSALLWVSLPIIMATLVTPEDSVRYTWLLVAIVLSILLFQMTYWIGSQRYSTRYYYEAIGAVVLLSALPIGWLARRVGRGLVYGGLGVVLMASLLGYSLPRVGVLEGFNNVSRQHLEALEARRVDERPILVLVTGAASGEDRVSWRAMGTFMSQTSPYLDSDIVLAWDYMSAGVRERILAQFPDHQVITLSAAGDEAIFLTPSMRNPS